MLECHQVTKQYSGHTVLDHVNISFTPNQKHVILGKSGCGKSTLLKIIADVIEPDEGTVIKNHEASPCPPVGMIFQSHNLWPNKTVLDNLTLAPKKVLKQKNADLKAKKLLHQFNLAHKAEAYPCELSGGEEQRCAVIRALMMPYQTIVMDEPNAALDPISTEQLIDCLNILKNKTIIISTHDLNFAEKIADKIYMMDKGSIKAINNISISNYKI